MYYDLMMNEMVWDGGGLSVAVSSATIAEAHLCG
jgi:hypothetical protein